MPLLFQTVLERPICFLHNKNRAKDYFKLVKCADGKDIVGRINPSLAETLGSTDSNLLENVCFKREARQDSALR